MLTKTKWLMAGIGTLLLVGTALAVAADGSTSVDASVAAGASWHDGRWTKTGSAVSGEFVSFSFDPATGAVSDYAEQGHVLFTSITLSQYNASDAKAQAHGRVIAATDGDLLRALVFDARNAAFAMRAPAGNTITLVAADGVQLDYHADEKGWSPKGVLLRDGNRTARLVTEGDANVTVSGQTITIVLGAGSGLHFKIDGHPWEDAKEKLAMFKLAHKAKARGKGHGHAWGLGRGQAQGKGQDKGKGRADA